jgi:bifunctional non-homologous end joining protein LigD
LVDSQVGDVPTRLDGDDLRREPLELRKAMLASVLARAGHGIRFNEHMICDDGDIVFRHACLMGLEGIVSKRKGSPYRSGRSPDWLKVKNPGCEAVRREAEEDWGRDRRPRRISWRRRPSESE